MKSPYRLYLTTAIVLAGAAPAGAQEDLGWPRQYDASDGRTVVVYQPQIDTWTDYTGIEAWAAVVIVDPRDSTSIPGAVRLTARTQANMDTRTVLIFGIEIEQARFPSVDSATADSLSELMHEIVPSEKTLALDRLLADVERAGIIGDPREIALGMDPPTVFVSEDPAILVLVDGEPIHHGIEGARLSYVVNTNWDLLFDSTSSSYYLLHEDMWLWTDSLAGGEWHGGYPLPPSFSSIGYDENWTTVRESFPGRPVLQSEIPAVFISTAPAELILTQGPPALAPIPETNLLYVANTESDLFRHLIDNQYYYLVSGRWFRAANLAGPWFAAYEDLPSDFADIPPNHPRGDVRASVPGTPEANEALLMANIPQTAAVTRSEATANVVYSGDPEFRLIKGTNMSYAVNTASDVILVDDVYYLCQDAVWFRSDSPTGPWVLSDVVPNDIYAMPATSPVYHTTHVYVYDSTPDVVYVGYTPGYAGVYASWGYVVYGTGYYYPPYTYWGPAYPYPFYYPYPHSYGFAAYYNPYTGTYGRGASVYGPYGGMGRGAAYNPYTGTYARGARAWGPYGSTAWADAYNPRTGTYAATRQSRNAYSQWGSSVVTRGDEWARGGHYIDSRGAGGGFRTSEGAGAVGFRGDERAGGAVRTREGDLYVGGDGQVYRRGQDGGWSSYSDGGWQPAEQTGDRAQAMRDRDRAQIDQSRAADRRAAAAAAGTNRQNVTQNLQRDYQARAQGSRRVNDYQSGRSTGTTRSRPRSAGRRRR